jgi:hypothetical protein
MEKKPLIVKGLVVGIILLFIGLSLSPGINAENVHEVSILDHSLKMVPVRVLCYEFKPDGTIKKNTILLPRSEHQNMIQALLLTTSSDEKLKIYQRYGIIPSNVTIQSMKENYDYFLNEKNIDVSVIQKYVTPRKTTLGLKYVFNINCKIEVGGFFNFHFIVGMSAFTRYWNLYGITPFEIPGIDLCNLRFTGMGEVDIENGILPDSDSSLDSMISIVLGFVGYYIVPFVYETFFAIPFPLFEFASDFFGYAVFIYAMGKVRWDPY